MQPTEIATIAEPAKRFQCRHIFTDGRRCASPCLRREEFCYYHHTTRRPVQPSDLKGPPALPWRPHPPQSV